ncbi:MAG: hypothetical protein A2092_01810 [Rhodobacteraceae bacterium GWE1_64_9]|nr:hypothetical protein [Gemmobacter sp.]OHC43261.1 MAG: hypothetical protein A2092_01810 [Rhodobacteraceae bacterium GWE1_64_9]HBU15424.1 hypothetical protein [Gemmobacter sp.]
MTDIFRAGLIIALIFTMLRTRAVTGTALPLLAGIVFVAVVVPLTSAGPAIGPMWMQIALGLVSNAILLAIGLAVWSLAVRLRR